MAVFSGSWPTGVGCMCMFTATGETTVFLLSICSSHQGVGQSSLVLCFPSPSPSPAGTHLGVSSQLLAPLSPQAPPPSQAAHLTIWLLFFQSRCKGLHQRPGTSVIPHSCFYGQASIVHIVCMETCRREGIMWTTCTWSQAQHIWQYAAGLPHHVFEINEGNRKAWSLYMHVWCCHCLRGSLVNHTLLVLSDLWKKNYNMSREKKSQTSVGANETCWGKCMLKHLPIFPWSLLGRTKMHCWKRWVVSQEEGVVFYFVIITSHIIDLLLLKWKNFYFLQFISWERGCRKELFSVALLILTISIIERN